MESGSYSARTIDARRRLVILLARRTRMDPADCGWRDLAAFLADHRLSRSTRQTYRTGLRQWYSWLVRNQLRADNPVDMLPRIKTPRATPRPISTDQLAQALGSGRFYRKTRTMILLAAYEGLRAHEIAIMRGEYIRGSDLRVIGKGGVDVTIPLHEIVAAEAELYPRIGWWFPSPHDRTQPMTAKAVSSTVSKALRRAGVDATCHQARHWYGTESLHSAGGNLRVAQELLRHASPATTARYTRIDDEQMRAAVDALPTPLYSLGTRRSGVLT